MQLVWRRRSVLEKGQMVFRLCLVVSVCLFFVSRDIRLLEAVLGFFVVLHRLSLARSVMPALFCSFLQRLEVAEDQLAKKGRRIARMLCVRVFIISCMVGAYYALSAHIFFYGATMVVLVLVIFSVARVCYLLFAFGGRRVPLQNEISALETVLLMFLLLWARWKTSSGPLSFTLF